MMLPHMDNNYLSPYRLSEKLDSAKMQLKLENNFDETVREMTKNQRSEVE